MDTNFRVSNLTEAMVAAVVAEAPEPYDAAAKTIRQTVQVALRALPAWDPASDLAVEDAVRGGVQALIRADLDVCRGGYLVLCELTEMAGETGRDPHDTMMSGMRAIASLKRLVSPVQLERLTRAIEHGFSGAGSTFAFMLKTVGTAPVSAWQTQFD